MDDLNIRKSGRAGRITFTRPKALNALSHDMALAIHDALDGWRDDAQVELVIIGLGSHAMIKSYKRTCTMPS